MAYEHLLPAPATALAKHAIRRAGHVTLSEALALEREHQIRLFKTREARDAIAAFLEQRDVARQQRRRAAPKETA